MYIYIYIYIYNKRHFCSSVEGLAPRGGLRLTVFALLVSQVFELLANLLCPLKAAFFLAGDFGQLLSDLRLL